MAAASDENVEAESNCDAAAPRRKHLNYICKNRNKSQKNTSLRFQKKIHFFFSDDGDDDGALSYSKIFRAHGCGRCILISIIYFILQKRAKRGVEAGISKQSQAASPQISRNRPIWEIPDKVA